MTTRRGILVVLEGLDHCGKSSQARLLQQAFPNSHLACFPERSTVLGQLINQYLKGDLEMDDRAIHLLFSANRWERMQALTQLLEAGTTVVLDRYVYSGCAYSAAKGLPLAWCQAPDQGLIRPDLVVYLKLTAQQAVVRSGFGSERYERLAFQEKVAAVFDQMLLSLPYCLTLDATESVEVLAARILSKVQEVREEETRALGFL